MTTQFLTFTHDHHHDAGSTSTFGFWIFTLSNFILFATLFTTYVVLRNHTFGAIGIKQIVSLPYIVVQSIFLISCSFTMGLSVTALLKNHRNKILFWLFATFALGIMFIIMQMHIFNYLIETGNNWQRSAFLSSYFTLLGSHGLYLIGALIWTLVLFFQFIGQGITTRMQVRIECLAMYWNFLNIIWIFIFLIVYLVGAI